MVVVQSEQSRGGHEPTLSLPVLVGVNTSLTTGVAGAPAIPHPLTNAPQQAEIKAIRRSS